jgi:hypothetical protein
MNYRNLTRDEVSILEQQGCIAEDWSKITVKQDFIPGKIRNIQFAGHNKLGIFSEMIEIDKGIHKPAGLQNSYLKDCEIDDEVYISNVGNLIGYHVQTHVVVENVNTLVVNGESTFGNGIEIEILNEGGGRPLILYNRLSSQIAYMMVLYRHEKEAIGKVEMMIQKYVDSTRSNRGIIGEGTKILHSSAVRNIQIGEYAVISGAALLENGTIASSINDPSVVGDNVIAKDFIILSGSRVEEGSIIEKCFIGQGVRIGKQLSAENSAFFANSDGFNSEVLSIFAGPYTVTHHKSTLLIAGLFSFYNAGSGSNQSNHMYKLGPVHQGILERGSKTGSSSYLMWPSRIGAFTLVIGKHYSHLDVSDFPFSYLLESNGTSILMPSLNLFTAGTYRDSAKWPKRDRRKDDDKLDLIIFDLFNPYLIGKIIKSIRILENLDKETPVDQKLVEYKGAFIKRPKLALYRQNYDLAARIYIGNQIVKKLGQFNSKNSLMEIRESLNQGKQTISDHWVDMAGMITPASAVDDLVDSIRSGKITVLDEIKETLFTLYRQYDQFEWEYCRKLIKEYLNVDPGKIEPGQLISMIDEWKNNLIKQNDLIMKDAEKEFDSNRRIGYGIDGDEQIKNTDFQAVRGSYEENKFILELKEASKKIIKQSEDLTAFISSLS